MLIFIVNQLNENILKWKLCRFFRTSCLKSIILGIRNKTEVTSVTSVWPFSIDIFLSTSSLSLSWIFFIVSLSLLTVSIRQDIAFCCIDKNDFISSTESEKETKWRLKCVEKLKRKNRIRLKTIERESPANLVPEHNQPDWLGSIDCAAFAFERVARSKVLCIELVLKLMLAYFLIYCVIFPLQVTTQYQLFG